MTRAILVAAALALAACGGEPQCQPGAMRCAGATIQSCDQAGEWQHDVACQVGCIEGSWHPSPLMRAYCAPVAP